MRLLIKDCKFKSYTPKQYCFQRPYSANDNLNHGCVRIFPFNCFYNINFLLVLHCNLKNKDP